MEDVLAVVLIFGGGTLVFLSFSPVGKALADRIRGRSQTPPDPEILADLDQLRAEVGELQERMDFTERLLSQQREAGQIGTGEGA